MAYANTPILTGADPKPTGAKMAGRLYRDYSSYLRETFGCRVQKISLDAGLGCPNRDGIVGRGGCIYCNEKGSGTGAARFAGILEQIRAGKERLAAKYKAKKFIAYFQSFSNTYAPLPKLAALYDQALSDPDVVGLSIGTRPDCVTDQTLDYLAVLGENHLIWLEYGLQSAKDETLERIRRGHSVADFIDAVKRTRARKIPVCAHVILGLPAENTEDMLRTARFLALQDVQAVKIHLLYVIRGTTLDEMYSSGAYSSLSREGYAAAVGEFLALLPPHIIIQRLTGDPHPEELVSPAWALDKQRNLQAVRAYMEEKGLYQGKNYG
ncbi:MAG: TIGR01212 family radical SAM protein [Syntrophobacteraceae bacterium]|jgi:radical SAM protein (TIGR01212 family)